MFLAVLIVVVKVRVAGSHAISDCTFPTSIDIDLVMSLQKHRGVTVGKKPWSVFDSSNIEKNKSLKGTHNRGMTMGKNTKVSVRTPNH